MIEALDLNPGMCVLEIGTGTGCHADLLAEPLGAPSSVCLVEPRLEILKFAGRTLRQEAYDGVRPFAQDGALGVLEGALFDRIEVTAGCPDISFAWLEQLASEGMLLASVQHGHLDPPLQVRAANSGSAFARAVGNASFILLAGVLDSPNAWQTFLIGGMPAA